MYEDEIEMGKGTLDLKTLEVLHQGDYAYETGLYEYTDDCKPGIDSRQWQIYCGMGKTK